MPQELLSNSSNLEHFLSYAVYVCHGIGFVNSYSS